MDVLGCFRWTFRLADSRSVDQATARNLAMNKPVLAWAIGRQLSAIVSLDACNISDLEWAVFDGHSGWQTADLLTKQLLPFVRRKLSEAKPASNS
jgi:pyruvate dehydrogenase phosphatase